VRCPGQLPSEERAIAAPVPTYGTLGPGAARRLTIAATPDPKNVNSTPVAPAGNEETPTPGILAVAFGTTARPEAA
jgi:hypothetical protein